MPFLLLVFSHLLPAQNSASPLPATIAAPESSLSDEPAQPPPSSGSHESWDELALRGSELRADIPVIGERISNPDFTRELIRVQWRSGDPIDLYVIRPTGVSKPPVVLYLYGYPAEASKFLNDDLCRKLTRGGLAAVGFEATLTGQRYHDVPMQEWFVSDLQQSLTITVHDIQMVLNYLATRTDVDVGRVGVFGQGSGGTAAILTATVDQRIKAVDVIDPWGDWPEWLAQSPVVPDAERPQYLKPEFLTGLAPLDPVTQLPKVDPQRFRLQQTLFSNATPEISAKRIAAAVPPSAQVICYETQQDYAEMAARDGRILDWLWNKLNVKE